MTTNNASETFRELLREAWGKYRRECEIVGKEPSAEEFLDSA